MGMTLNGLNKIRDIIGTTIDALEYGNTDEPGTAEDTDLKSPIANSESVNVSTSVKDQHIIITGTFPSTAPGGAIGEMIWKNLADDLAISRVVHEGTIHSVGDSSVSADFVYSTRFFIRSRT